MGLPPKERLLNLQKFVNEKIGQNVDLTEGIKILSEQGGSSVVAQFEETVLAEPNYTDFFTLSDRFDNYDILYILDNYGHKHWFVPEFFDDISNVGVICFNRIGTNIYTSWRYDNNDKKSFYRDGRRDFDIAKFVGLKCTNGTIEKHHIFQNTNRNKDGVSFETDIDLFEQDILFFLANSGSYDELQPAYYPTVIDRNNSLSNGLGLVLSGICNGYSQNPTPVEITNHNVYNAPVLSLWSCKFVNN